MMLTDFCILKRLGQLVGETKVMCVFSFVVERVGQMSVQKHKFVSGGVGEISNSLSEKCSL
jgi:hypothetical protein